MKEQSDNLFEVLVVEDNQDDAELTIRAVMRSNKNAFIIHFWNGEEALSFIQGRIPERKPTANLKLIILNLGIPKIEGLDLLRKLREHPVTRFIPVVIFTASVENSKISEAYRFGANSYVIKPTRYEEYMNQVSAITHYWTSINSWLEK